VTPAGSAASDSGTYVSDPADESDLDPLIVPVFRTPPNFAIGFDVGVGVFGGLCEGCDRGVGGLSVGVLGGAQIARRIAVLADLWSIMHLLPVDDPEHGVVAHTFATAALHVWATPVLWVRAGAGAGMFSLTSNLEDSYDFGPGITASVGGEALHRPDSAIAIMLRFGAGRYATDDGGADDHVWLYNLAATVGWQWY
jgi:hypothetical protein